jgi:ferredoxin
MCEFCIEHGEGKKWYLQTKNYAKELLNEERKRYITEFWEKFEENIAGESGLTALDRLVAANPAGAKAFFSPVEEQMRKQHWGQVIPLEDVEQILERCVSVVRVPCACRIVIRGVHDARFCFCLAAFKSDFWPKGVFDQLPDYSKDLEVLTKEEAKREFQKLDRQGLVHSVWTHGTPFISAICNCTPRDCLALRMRLGVGLSTFFKAEYVAAIDLEKCNGCRDCMKICNFGAINYSASLRRCSINQLQCFGCGLCRAECPSDAISFLDRNAIPALAKDW